MARELDAALSRYISSVHQSPKLSREEEQRLAVRWREHGDPAAADALARASLRHVVALALQYRRYGVPLSELIAEGNFGIVQALKKFEPERGNRFATYASHWVRAYIVNYIIRSWSLVGAGTGPLRSKLFFKLRRERIRISNLVGEGEHADRLLAEKFGVTPAQVNAMLRRLEQRDVSLDTRVYGDSAPSLADTLPGTEPDHLEKLAAHEWRELARDAVQLALQALDARERYVVEQRLMADSEDELSLAEIGRRLGVSRERARQIEARAKKKLKTRITQLSRQERSLHRRAGVAQLENLAQQPGTSAC